MDGHNLNTSNNNEYPIFISSVSDDHQLVNIGGWKSSGKISSPFYTLQSLSMVYFGKIYSLDIENIDIPITSSINLFDTNKNCTEYESYMPFKMMINHLK